MLARTGSSRTHKPRAKRRKTHEYLISRSLSRHNRCYFAGSIRLLGKGTSRIMPTVTLTIVKNGETVAGVRHHLTLETGDQVDALAVLTDDNGVVRARFPEDMYADLKRQQDDLDQTRADFADTVNQFVEDTAVSDACDYSEFAYCACGDPDCCNADLEDASNVYQGPVVSVDAGLLITFEDGTIQFVPEAD